MTKANVATNDTSQECVDKTSEIVHEPWSPVSIGVDITEEGAHVVGIYTLDNDTSQVFYAKYYPVPQRKPEQEPVACVEYIPCCTDQTCPKCKAATPLQRTWVGLEDDDEIDWDGGDIKSFVRAIEAKLKEKNT